MRNTDGSLFLQVLRLVDELIHLGAEVGTHILNYRCRETSSHLVIIAPVKERIAQGQTLVLVLHLYQAVQLEMDQA